MGHRNLSALYTSIIVALALMGSSSLKPAAAGTSSTIVRKHHPNIVLINMDDMGYGDLPAYGAIQYDTPNIDKLAAQGMRFTNAYSAEPICTASRAGLLIGAHPTRTGFYGAFSPGMKMGISKKDETIGGMLQKAGYVTGVIGKWGLGNAKQFLPLDHGFDYYYGLPYSTDMWPNDYHGQRLTHTLLGKLRLELKPYIYNKLVHKLNDYPTPAVLEGRRARGKPVHYRVAEYLRNMKDQGMLTIRYTRHAVNFINSHKHQPFFLYIANALMHVPIAVAPKFKGKSKQGLYGDAVEEIDWQVGQVLDTLKKDGLEKKTIVIFTSDNGPWLIFGNRAGSAGGLREGKMTAFEGGMREPFIIRWPGVVPAGTVNNKLLSQLDLMPTFAKITGAPLPSHKIDGVNVLPLFKGVNNPDPRKYIFYYYHKDDLMAVRKGKWKLVLPHEYVSNTNEVPGMDGFPGQSRTASIKISLYNLRRDPGERYSVVKGHPEIVKKMMKLVEQAQYRLGDTLTHDPGHDRWPLARCSPCDFPGISKKWLEHRAARKAWEERHLVKLDK